MNTQAGARRARTLLRAAVAALIGAVTVVALAQPAPAHGPGAAACRHAVVRVITTYGEPVRIAGSLCGDRHARSVEVLVSGITYDRTYWRVPGHSYVDAAARRGRATLVIDRLGTGDSTHPPAERVTVAEHAHVAGQVVLALRSGRVDGRRFRWVTGVGHSFGVGVWAVLFHTTAADYPGRPDALVLQDFMHTVNPPVAAAVGAARWPAADDPRLRGAGLPAGYLTTRPGTRELFYEPSHAARWVIERDERTKSTTTLAELASLAQARDPEASRAIDVPTLVLLGAYDHLYCSAELPCRRRADLAQREASFYTGVPGGPRWVVLPLAGHSSALHRDAHLNFARVGDWVRSTTPRRFW